MLFAYQPVYRFFGTVHQMGTIMLGVDSNLAEVH